MERELFPVFMKYVPNRTTELLDIVAHVHNLDCLCPNYKTWIEEYAALYGHTNDTTENFFRNIMKYLDYNPELAKNLVLRFDRFLNDFFVHINVQQKIIINIADMFFKKVENYHS